MGTEPMRLLSDYDGATWFCPCGSQRDTGPSSDSRADDRWFATHKPHCNGTYVETVTDDGMRAYATRPEPRVVKFNG